MLDGRMKETSQTFLTKMHTSGTPHGSRQAFGGASPEQDVHRPVPPYMLPSQPAGYISVLRSWILSQL